ncbi:MAG: methyl-accepting chemotaxis protein [Prochloraceae cyanobacterium]|nr:methyl-accepting chemotaxis protein [Prochloraceae cyanobacterium]
MSDYSLSDTTNSPNGKSATPPHLDSNECVSKIISASELEKSGEIEQAIAIYQEIVELDTEGTYRAIAQKSLEKLQKSQPDSVSSTRATSAIPATAETATNESLPLFQRLLKQFDNLPIRTKQLSALFTSELISVVGLVGIGSFLIITTGRTQLLKQAESELAVTQINYNIKINQMGFGFRGQSDNAAIIAAAKAHTNSQPLTAKLQKQVKEILQNEIQARQIEYATLVGKDRRIISNAKANRAGEIFDPNGLVSKVLKSPAQIKTSQIVSWSELEKENPPLPEGFSNRSALIRYTVTPVRDRVSGSILGVLVSGDIVNKKLPIVENTLKSFKGGYSAVYMRDSDNKFSLATSLQEGETDKLEQAKRNQPLPNDKLLDSAISQVGETTTERLSLEGKSCSSIPLPWSPKCYSMAAMAIPDSSGEPVAVLVRGIDEQSLDALILNSLGLQGVVLFFALLADVFLALLLGRAIVTPLQKLRQMAESFSQGKRDVRVETTATDEIGKLSLSFNQMADNIVATEADLAQQNEQKEAEAKKQYQAKRNLEEEVVKLLLEIESAQRGDLTVKGQVTDGVVGSIADAFNATVSKLRQLLLEVQTVSNQVGQKARSGETSVRQLSDSALTQAGEIAETLKNVAAINDSIQKVADSATEAANITRQALNKTQEGDATMDETVNSIENIRTTVADTAKKVKQLAESSQEISKIVSIISGISEKTNILAFNASVEAARAGEHGEGFKIVAEEVRRLADRVTEATKDIQQLVNTIQKETVLVLETIDSSTTEVVQGTKLVGKTKQILQDLAGTSQTIDQYIQKISNSTKAQTNASEQVNQTMEKVAKIATGNSSEAQEVLESLRVLVKDSEELQSSVGRFQL